MRLFFISKKKKEGEPMAAKGKYADWITPEGLLKIEGWARDGLTDEQIAENIGIGTTTLYRWKEEFEVFRETLKKGKEVVDRQVENALFKRAVGYEYIETTREAVKDPETGETNLIVTKEVTKQVIPDTTAQIFWLKNRKPDKWRDKPGYEDTRDLDRLDAILEGLKSNAES